MENLIETLFNSLNESKNEKSMEYREADKKFGTLFDEILTIAGERNREIMNEFESQYSTVEWISKKDSFSDGFKTAIKLVFLSLN